MILAGIDIGTNTLRLLIADVHLQSFHEISSDRKITRLGQHLEKTGLLSPESQQRSVDCIAEFSRIIKQHAVCHVKAVGTSALRQAANAGAFISSVKEQAGIDVRIIEGAEEAYLTLLGVSRALFRGEAVAPNKTTPGIVLDIGGGSTEVIYTGAQDPKTFSLPLGAVYLTERFIKNDPPSEYDIEQLRRAVRKEIQTLGPAERFEVTAMAGTAGTITTLAAIDKKMTSYDPGVVNGSELARSSIDEIVLTLAMKTISERRSLPGLETGREDIILAGAVIVQEMMNYFSMERMLVSDWGLREGIVLDLYEKITQGAVNSI